MARRGSSSVVYYPSASECRAGEGQWTKGHGPSAVLAVTSARVRCYVGGMLANELASIMIYYANWHRRNFETSGFDSSLMHGREYG